MMRLILTLALLATVALGAASISDARTICDQGGGNCVDLQGTAPAAPPPKTGPAVTPWQAHHWAMLDAQGLYQAERFAYDYGVNRCKRLARYVFRCGIYVDVFDPAISGNVRCTQQLRLYKLPGQEIGSTVIGGARGTRCARR